VTTLESALLRVARFFTQSKQHDPRLKGYALIGALAVSARGKPRATHDIDLLLSADRTYFTDTLPQLAEHLGGHCEQHKGAPGDPIAYLARIYDEQGAPLIDCLQAQWKWEDEMIQAAEPVALGDVQIPVLKPEDLVVLKLRAGGPQDVLDAQELIRVVTFEHLDRKRVTNMAKLARVDKKLAQLLRKCRPVKD
jgi:predicted nucleotidyltransferase